VVVKLSFGVLPFPIVPIADSRIHIGLLLALVAICTAKTDTDLVDQRLKAAQQHYEEHYGQANRPSEVIRW